MSAPRPVRRDMSYRKPVPKYVPSPPPAPSILPPTPFQRLSLYSESAKHNDLPPLPAGWRDAIDKAVTNDRSPFENPFTNMDDEIGHRPLSGRADSRAGQVSSPSMSDGSDNYSISEYSEEELVTAPNSPIPWIQSPRSRKRTLPLEYRPPTPPLPAYVKRRRLPDSESTSGVVVPTLHYYATYPDDFPSFLDLNANQGGAGPSTTLEPDYDADVDRHKLQTATSFDTTQSSSATGLSSSSTRVASDCASVTDARDTWLRDTWYILPVHPYPGAEEKTNQIPITSVDIPRFWVRLGKLGNLLKMKIMSFKAAAFSTCDCTSPV